MLYFETLKIDPSEKEEINHYLTTEPKNESEMFHENDRISEGVTFGNGNFMVIELCGVSSFEEGGCNKPWTQAVLFSEDGYEIGCSEVWDEYFGEWRIEVGEDTYVVRVE